MKEARRAVGAFIALVVTVAAGFVGVIASKASPWHKGAFIAWVVVLIGAGVVAFAAAVPDFAEWLGGMARSLMRTARRPPKLITNRWKYTSDGMKSSASVSVQELALPGTGHRQQPGERAQWVRFVVLVPCHQISSDADVGELWTSFQAFLRRPAVSALVGQAVGGRTGAGMEPVGDE